MHDDTPQTVASRVRDTRRVPLGELADRGNENPGKRSEGEFNSSI